MFDTLLYYPRVLQEVKEIKCLCKLYDKELENIYKNMNRILDNSFVSSLDEYGSARLENILSLYPNIQDSIETRRVRIFSKLNQKLPYTLKGLEQQLKLICGEDGYLLYVDYNKYLVVVKISLKSKSSFTVIKELLKNMIPCNMVVDLDYLYNTHFTLSKFKNMALEKYTYKQLRDEVLI